MKTLDEVIKGMEHCHEDNCMECPYQFEPRDFDCITQCQYSDALHYLKEYRSLDSLDAVAFPEDDNPALTWDELKQMEGKPVWVESSDSFNRHRWMFVGEWFDDDEMRLFDMGNDYPDYVSKNVYESGTWQAYRKEL